MASEPTYSDGDLVSQLIGACHQDQATAKRLYQQLVVEQQRVIDGPGGRMQLTKDQLADFVERFSSEVGVEIWQSKRRKDNEI